MAPQAHWPWRSSNVELVVVDGEVAMMEGCRWIV